MERTKLITLLLTRECNLRCSYCYVKSYTGGTMSLKTAQDIISQVFEKAAGSFGRVEFAFLGGEPLCAFHRLREICEWTWGREWPLPYVFSASTNGTLCTDEIRRWMAEHNRLFFPSLSYDGLICAQDVNRCGSGSQIDLDFFHQYWPDVPVKMTITEESVRYLFQNIQLLNERGIQVNDTFADGVPPWKESSLRILDQQLQMLCDEQLKRPQPHPSDLLSIDLTKILSDGKRSLFACDAGRTRITYDWDGKEYGCHLLSPLVLSSWQMDVLPSALFGERPLQDPCSGCELDMLCPSCEGNSYRLNQSCWLREDKTCRLFRHQLYFACEFQMKRLLRKKERDEKDIYTFVSIQRILRTKPMREIRQYCTA